MRQIVRTQDEWIVCVLASEETAAEASQPPFSHRDSRCHRNEGTHTVLWGLPKGHDGLLFSSQQNLRFCMLISFTIDRFSFDPLFNFYG